MVFKQLLLLLLLLGSFVVVTGEQQGEEEGIIYNGCSLTGGINDEDVTGNTNNLDGSTFDIKKCFLENQMMKGNMDAHMRGFAGPGRPLHGEGGESEEGEGRPQGFSSFMVEIQLTKDRPAMQFELQPSVEENETMLGGGNKPGGMQFMGFHGKKRAKRGGRKQSVNDGGEENLRTIGDIADNDNDDDDEESLSEINMIANEKNGHLAGSAHLGNSIFHFETSTAGKSDKVIVATEIKKEDMPPDEPSNFSRMDYLKPSKKDHDRFLLRGGSSSHNDDNIRSLISSEGGVVYLDVLVPYTRRTLCVMNGLTGATCDATEARKETVLNRIMLAIEETNVALQSSGIINKKFRLAHSFLIEDTPDGWDETSISYNQVLSATANRDGFMDSINTQRDVYGADVVVTMIDHPDSCGLAYGGNPVDEEWAYAIVSWICSTGYYSFGHEIAHLLGAKHDRYTEKCPSGCCTVDDVDAASCDNYGYIDPSNRYRSIMSYDCPIEGGCPRLQMFSTPHHMIPVNNVPTYPMGSDNSETNNADIISKNFHTVANYRHPPNNMEEIVADKVDVSTEHNTTTDGSSTATAEAELTSTIETTCGDGFCRRRDGENCTTCPEDCPSGTYEGTTSSRTSKCGNSICEAGETCHSCPKDCAKRELDSNLEMNFCCIGGPASDALTASIPNGLHCSDRLCQFGLLCSDPSEEGDDNPVSTTEYCCGDAICSPGEGIWKGGDGGCPTDCHCVNNGICDFWEDRGCEDCLFKNIHETTCLEHGRACTGISPNPCCGTCQQINDTSDASMCVASA